LHLFHEYYSATVANKACVIMTVISVLCELGYCIMVMNCPFALHLLCSLRT